MDHKLWFDLTHFRTSSGIGEYVTSYSQSVSPFEVVVRSKGTGGSGVFYPRYGEGRNNLYRNEGVWFTNRCVSLLF